MIRVAIALALAVAAAVPAAPAELEPDAIRLQIELEPRAHPPFVDEMILLTIHGAYLPPITLEKLKQPEMPGFDWMQLGSDRWYRTDRRGLSVLNLERRMALFPQKAGRLEIPAFTHELQLLAPDGTRFTHLAKSNTLSVEVEERPDVADWWFPVRRISVSDEWSNPPGRLKEGGGALRIVTLRAVGVAPELVPPMPEMTAAGALVFAHPERRIVTLGPDGPITRAFWRWTIRPEGPTAGFVNPVTIGYFDTVARESREITLSAQRVALEGAGAAAAAAPEAPEMEPPTAADPARDWSPPPVIGLGAGLLAGLFATFGLWRGVGRAGLAAALRRIGRNPDLAAMRRAARAGDAPALWRSARAALAGAPAPDALRRLEAALFSGGHPPAPDLKEVVRAVVAQRRADDAPSPLRN